LLICSGNVGSGKSVFAKKLAEELGMRYFPELNLDLAYVTEEGFDFRSLNEQLPLKVRFPDLPDVFEYRDPTQTAVLQHQIYRLRYVNYLDALAHLYQTGQGCVIERSPWSDSVFADQLRNDNFFSSSFHNFYWLMRSQTISYLQRPHLVMYIDVNVDECHKNIQQRNKVHDPFVFLCSSITIGLITSNRDYFFPI
jgi:NADH dehydrogenase (ubiquinone) 1 alpha subcomplex subunit 10